MALLRKLVYHVLPFLIPFVVYLVYVVATNRSRSKGKILDETPWFWLITVGLGLSVLSILVYWYFSSEPIGRFYIPPRLEDGEIVPGKVVR